MIKKSVFDVCGGDCGACSRFREKNLSILPVLLKKKVYKKFVPPDTTAIKLLLDKRTKDTDVQKLTDEELLSLKSRLIDEFQKNSI